MNSFATDAATRSYLKRHYPTLAAGEPWFCQAQVPRLLAREGEALDWPQDPKQEWCPPGHGDLYPSLLGSGLLHRWLAEGREFLFAANGDNLGATLDPRLLDYFAASGLDFLMEVCERTEADRKGGHLARRRADGTLILRERAQTRPDEVVAFEDFRRHRYFNSNNLWIRLKALDAALRQHKGALPLPLIVNAKQLGTGSAARAVVQLESAMGAAIERFSRAGAIVVRRDRFLPVKDTNDLLRLRSDCYVDAGDGCLRLADSVDAAPRVRLSEHYRTFAEFARLCAAGVPSLRQCVELEIDGALNLSSQVVCRGRVRFVGASGVIPPGVYENCEVAI
jgi:UDP-N-acetylglucosamine pyrophosphorylase